MSVHGKRGSLLRPEMADLSNEDASSNLFGQPYSLQLTPLK